MLKDESENLWNDIDNEEKIIKKKDGKYKYLQKILNSLSLKKISKSFQIFNKPYKNGDNNNALYKFGKLMIFTYRKNFKKIYNSSGKSFTSDTHWGCMIRCGQMILCRAIYKILKKCKLDTFYAMSYSFRLFNDFDLNYNMLHIYFKGMGDLFKQMYKMKHIENGEIVIDQVYPPFGIKNLCKVGELFNKKAGEWFSDVVITQVFKAIVDHFALFKHPKFNTEIFTFQSYVEFQEILDTCCIEYEEHKNIIDPKRDDYFVSNGKKYYFNKRGIIFVSVKLGLTTVSKEYFSSIKKVFNCKECIGIIGGRPRLAYYFFGCSSKTDELLYLDPHTTQEAVEILDERSMIEKHVLKDSNFLHMSKLSPGFTIGFCFRNFKELVELYGFLKRIKSDKNPILGLNSKPIKDYISADDDFDIENKKDDF